MEIFLPGDEAEEEEEFSEPVRGMKRDLEDPRLAYVRGGVLELFILRVVDEVRMGVHRLIQIVTRRRWSKGFSKI